MWFFSEFYPGFIFSLFLAILSLKTVISDLVTMASSFFSEFGLMWYLGELRKDEFRKFKELLKETPVQLGLQQLPWADVKKGTREDLANLLAKHYGEEQAWHMTFFIFQKINRMDLCEKAKKEITGEGGLGSAGGDRASDPEDYVSRLTNGLHLPSPSSQQGENAL